MSLTYPEPPVSTTTEAEYIPAYARKPVRQKKVRSWMILAPIGAVVLLGSGAAMLWNSDDAAAPLAEPVAAPMTVAPATAPVAAPMEAAPAALTPTAPLEAAPVAVPAARSETVRREAPVQRRAAPAVAQRVEPTPVEPTGPRPYSASPATPGLNAAPPAPAITPVPATPPAPAISTQPLG